MHLLGTADCGIIVRASSNVLTEINYFSQLIVVLMSGYRTSGLMYLRHVYLKKSQRKNPITKGPKEN
jgi:hypothetical protein